MQVSIKTGAPGSYRGVSLVNQSTVLENVLLGPISTFLELLQPYSGRLDTGPQTGSRLKPDTPD